MSQFEFFSSFPSCWTYSSLSSNASQQDLNRQYPRRLLVYSTMPCHIRPHHAVVAHTEFMHPSSYIITLHCVMTSSYQAVLSSYDIWGCCVSRVGSPFECSFNLSCHSSCVSDLGSDALSDLGSSVGANSNLLSDSSKDPQRSVAPKRVSENG